MEYRNKELIFDLIEDNNTRLRDGLSYDEKLDCGRLFDMIYRRGVISGYYLRKYDKVLQKLCRVGGPLSISRYLSYHNAFEANMSHIVDLVAEFRNQKINGYEIDLNEIARGLDAFKEFLEEKRGVYESHSLLGMEAVDANAKVSNDLMHKVEQLRSQISQDMQFHKDFVAKSNSYKGAQYAFRRKKEEYDRLSVFGKLAALFNGQKKELNEARKQMSASYVSRNYDSYLQQQQSKTGGRGR